MLLSLIWLAPELSLRTQTVSRLLFHCGDKRQPEIRLRSQAILNYESKDLGNVIKPDSDTTTGLPT